MVKICAILPAFLFFQVAQAQTAPPRFVRAVGEATVPSKPDQAKVQFAVVTQAVTADAAASQNATQVATLMAADGANAQESFFNKRYCRSSTGRGGVLDCGFNTWQQCRVSE